MTLDEYREEQGLTWLRVSNELSEITRGEFGEDYIHPHRLWKLRNGAPPREYELRALAQWSGDIVHGFKG